MNNYSDNKDIPDSTAKQEESFYKQHFPVDSILGKYAAAEQENTNDKFDSVRMKKIGSSIKTLVFFTLIAMRIGLSSNTNDKIGITSKSVAAHEKDGQTFSSLSVRKANHLVNITKSGFETAAK